MPNSRVEPVILVRIGVDIDEVAAARLVKILWFVVRKTWELCDSYSVR